MPKKEIEITTPGQALNALAQALAHLKRGPSFVGQRDARGILMAAYNQVWEEVVAERPLA